MYRHVLTLLRGSAHDTAEQFTDHNALATLRQQIRDSARSIQASRYAIANAIAQYQSELDHQQIVTSKIADLEQRTIIALEKGQDELAQQAAETIAGLEDENETSSAAQKLFREQLANQKAQLREAQSILRELQRGARLAAAADSTRYPQRPGRQQSHRRLKCSSRNPGSPAETTTAGPAQSRGIGRSGPRRPTKDGHRRTGPGRLRQTTATHGQRRIGPSADQNQTE